MGAFCEGNVVNTMLTRRLLQLLPMLFFISLVAFLLSAERPRRVYLRIKGAVDRISATILGILGCKLILTSFSR